MLANLLGNAAKYTPPRGRIELTGSLDGSFVVIAVRDNGHGITPTLMPDLFDMFVQGERAADRSEGGLGVGLAVVRALVELHGGTVTAHSDGPGTGATFTVRWPRATNATQTVQMKPLARPKTTCLRVLIVGDNRDAAEMLAELVRLAGHEAVTVCDPTAAVSAAQEHGPHMALLDLEMPVLDGYQLAQQLRALPDWRDRPLIAVTGYDQPEDRERASQAGFARHLVKPVGITTLSELLVPLTATD